VKNKVATVTGGGAGIGRGICELLAARGAAVAVLDKNEASALDTAEGIRAAGGDAVGIGTDVTRSSEIARAFQVTRDNWGRIDVLVNNAGVLRLGSVTDTSEDDWDVVLGVNLKAVYLCCRHVLPTMIDTGAGAIVNIASVAAIGGSPKLAAYSASKAAVITLTRQMAVDYGPSGIRVNCVLPGTIPTAMQTVFFSEDEIAEKLADKAERKPLRRNGTPDDIAAAVAFLASDDADFITGVQLPVDGGATL